MLGKTEGRRTGQQRMTWLDSITDSMDTSLSKLWDGEGPGSLACCSLWSRKESDTSHRLNNNKEVTLGTPSWWRGHIYNIHMLICGPTCPLFHKIRSSFNDRTHFIWSPQRTETEAPKLRPPDAKSQLIEKDSDAGKDWRQKKMVAEDEMVRWHHWLNGHESEQTPGDSEGQGSLVC